MKDTKYALFSFLHHGWEVKLPLAFQSTSAEERSALVRSLNLELSQIAKEVDFDVIDEESAKKILSEAETIKHVCFNLYSFYTPVWEPMSFRKAVRIYKKNIVVDEKGGLYNKLGNFKFQASASPSGKGMPLEEVKLNIEMIVPERVLALLLSEKDLLETSSHRFLYKEDMPGRKPGEAYLVKFDPLETSALYGKKPDIFIDQSETLFFFKGFSPDAATQAFLGSMNLALSEKELEFSLAQEADFRYLIVQNRDGMERKLSQDF